MNTKNIERSRIGLALGLFGLAMFCLHWGTRAQENWSKLPVAFNQNLPERLGPAALLGVLGGMRAPAADWAYIDVLQYIGDNKNYQDGSFRRAYSLYREVLWLDPYFHFAVLEGCAFLTWFAGRFDESRKLMEEAMRVDPKFSRYRLYYAAMAYAETDVNHQEMIEFLKSEIQNPDAPEMLLRSVGNVITKHGNRTEAIHYWKTLLGRAKEQQTLERARAELAKLLKKDP